MRAPRAGRTEHVDPVRRRERVLQRPHHEWERRPGAKRLLHDRIEVLVIVGLRPLEHRPASASAVRAPTRPALTVDVWPWIISVRSDPAAAGRSAPRRRPSGHERGSPQRKRSRSAVSRSLPAPPKTTLVITRRTIRLTRGTAGNGSPSGHVSSSRPAIAPIVSRWRAEWSRSSGGPITPRKSLCSGSSRTSSDVVPTMGVSSASCA
jgi:hypothetical protein